MLIEITMKDPDVLHDSIREAVLDDVQKIALPDDEREALVDVRIDKAIKLANRWFEYGEYATIVIDTVAETATVKPRK